MIEILEHIKKLDESGNYRLADKLDDQVRKIYAQALGRIPAIPSYSDFLLKQMIQNQMKPKKETDTLSPTKNTDVATIRKQVNKIISDGIIQQKKIKTIENDLGALPSIEGKIGKVSEQTDQFNKDITNHTNDIANNTKDIRVLQDTIEAPEE
jgi:predicted transcriptional regulator